MTSSKNNQTFEKTSFLHGGNSPFIKEMYLNYLSDPKSIPQSWIEFFDGLNEDHEIIKNGSFAKIKPCKIVKVAICGKSLRNARKVNLRK